MLLDIFLAFLLGFMVAVRLTNYWNRITFREILKDLGITEQQLRDLARKNGIDFHTEDHKAAAEDDLTTIHIKIEQHHDQVYAFRTDNDQFLGQGHDRESLIKRLSERFQNVKLIIDEGADLIKKPETN